MSQIISDDVKQYYRKIVNDASYNGEPTRRYCYDVVLRNLDFFKEYPYMLWGEKGIEYREIDGCVYIVSGGGERLIYRLIWYDYTIMGSIWGELIPYFSDEMLMHLIGYTVGDYGYRYCYELFSKVLKIRRLE